MKSKCIDLKSNFFYIGGMSAEERRVWIQGGVAVAGYVVYLLLLAGGVGYKVAMLWTIGGGIVGGIVVSIVAGMIWREGLGEKDQRDREIDRFGQHIGTSMLVIGALAGLVLTLLEWPYVWIANALYLGFVLSAVLSSIASIVAYRRGFHSW